MNYTSKNVTIDFGYSQDRCVDGMCDSDRRSAGCVMCSGERCLTCGSGRVLFDGRCVGCLWMEECVFNNSVEIECVDDGDLSHCKNGEYVGCSEHVCINSTCKSGEMGENEQCEIGGKGCSDDCTCGYGWYNESGSVSCSSKCGDGKWVSDEECDSSAGCGDDCNCSVGWKGNGYGICKEVCGDGLVVGSEECDSTPG